MATELLEDMIDGSGGNATVSDVCMYSRQCVGVVCFLLIVLLLSPSHPPPPPTPLSLSSCSLPA